MSDMKCCKKCGNEFIPSKGLVNFCSLQCRNSRNFSNESISKKRNSNLNQTPWNKGLKNKWSKTSCLLCGEVIHHPNSKPKKYHPECWLKASGGYRKGSGVGKKGWYKGYWCDSSWELAWVIFNLDNNIIFSKNSKKFSYTYKGKTKNYIPDFLLESGKYIEIKGYFTEEVREKIKQFPHIIEVFDLKKMKPIIEYVELKYGKDFGRLYEEGRSDGH